MEKSNIRPPIGQEHIHQFHGFPQRILTPAQLKVHSEGHPCQEKVHRQQHIVIPKDSRSYPKARGHLWILAKSPACLGDPRQLGNQPLFRNPSTSGCNCSTSWTQAPQPGEKKAMREGRPVSPGANSMSAPVSKSFPPKDTALGFSRGGSSTGSWVSSPLPQAVRVKMTANKTPIKW